MASSRKHTAGQSVLRALFVGYVLLMLWLLFGQRLGTEIYSQELVKSINLRPFATIKHFIALLQSHSRGLVTHAVINLVGNVVMFVPLGIFLPLLFPRLRNFFKTFFLCLLLILAVEILQYYTFLGACDIDDLIFNMTGICIGYLTYKMKYH